MERQVRRSAEAEEKKDQVSWSCAIAAIRSRSGPLSFSLSLALSLTLFYSQGLSLSQQELWLKGRTDYSVKCNADCADADGTTTHSGASPHISFI